MLSNDDVVNPSRKYLARQERDDFHARVTAFISLANRREQRNLWRHTRDVFGASWAVEWENRQAVTRCVVP